MVAPILRIRFLVLALLMGAGSYQAHGQGTLSGIVRDSLTREPLELASIFLASTTYGASTNDKGQFSVRNVPAGQYDLIISYLGYSLYKRTITVGNGPQTLDLQLKPSTQHLQEVVVRPGSNRPGDYEKFAETFLGRTVFSRQCRIRNPKAVYVQYNADRNELTASSPTFLQVDNAALGYRIKYYGLEFTLNFREQYMSFYGWPVFQEMKPRNERQRQQWLQNRQRAYRGSLPHFLRSVYLNQVAAEGFLVQKMRVVPNPRFPRADSLAKALRQARHNQPFSPADQDSIARWTKVPRAFSLLYTAPRPIDSLRETDSGRVWLRFRDYVQITYRHEAPDPNYQPVRPVGAPSLPAPTQQVSTLMLHPLRAEVQANGQLLEPLAVFTDGYWGFEKMGEFLPTDYLPPTSAAPVR
ncbi:carboxypeptidase-like regulatory domain-containing protein [Hymenobacter sp. AT01-02]|uniref:carboxypeptidase-like regulatory domain-containing protein n=1 Tax=Hymenobacter sp. AT01-02 TaxID=1571877 RepID=UPI0005F19F88|nr:carboxypeptidase-like regulatory domain-containing protein [Hymenobacter sp. AT01-02]